MFRNWLVILLFLFPVLGYSGKKNKHIECTSSGEGFWVCETVSNKKARFDSDESDEVSSQNSHDLSAEGELDIDELDIDELDDIGELDIDALDIDALDIDALDIDVLGVSELNINKNKKKSG
ncbi:hypothetical protein CI610_02765 [invertebrate metagenome]|uniref:Uncharacterized protein n=1 Tax=invertebrate metagenome TaxID=1711999 RepID=A0A2H9T509_9ZZZZ